MLTDLIINNDSDLLLESTTLTKLCESIDTPRSLAVALLVTNNEWEQYLDLQINSEDYRNPRDFALDYLVTECMRKSEVLPLGIDRQAQAKASFYEAEELCRLTNERLRSIPSKRWVLIDRVQKVILNILGHLETSDLNEVSKLFRHGTGASTGVKGRGTVASDKFDKNCHMTADLIPFYKAITGPSWHDYARDPVIVQGSKFTSVPKNARTDRGICIEPTLNMYAQLGVGTYLKRKLKRSKIDLSTQENNKFLASIAHSHNLATIDLSMASDTVSWECVRLLLPPRWFHLLDLLRSKRTEVDGESIVLEKFSSMGNGFTFELESLIFSAIVRAIVPKREHGFTSVYGDDIILPRQYVPELIDTLNFLGFKVNTKKSFLAGSFFESCGSDWFNSTNVRPIYFRRGQDTKVPYLMQIANRIRLYCHQLGDGIYCDSIFRSIWVSLFKLAPKHVKKCLVPASFGDVGFIVSRQEANPHRFKPDQGWEALRVKYISLQPVRTRKSTYGVLLAALARLGPSDEEFISMKNSPQLVDIYTAGREPVRGYLRKPRSKIGHCYQWSDGFDWLL